MLSSKLAMGGCRLEYMRKGQKLIKAQQYVDILSKCSLLAFQLPAYTNHLIKNYSRLLHLCFTCHNAEMFLSQYYMHTNWQGNSNFAVMIQLIECFHKSSCQT